MSEVHPAAERGTTAEPSRWRDLAAIIALFAALSLVYWAGVLGLVGRVGLPLDDPYIHLQFARNLYQHGQMAFHPGTPSTGTTAPLYPVLVAGAYLLVRNWFAASFLLGILAGIGIAVCVYGMLAAWTGHRRLARWGGMLAVLVAPTVVQSYTGMEAAIYSFLFLVGLWLYANRRWHVAASALFALCVWLRPEFLMMLPLVALERLIHLRREASLSPARLLRELAPHLAIWSVMVSLYAAYHWSIDGHFVPNTFRAKAVAMSGPPHPEWFEGLPAALRYGQFRNILLAIFVWPLLALFTAGCSLGMNCAPLAFGLREGLLGVWRDPGPAAAAWRLAVLTLVGYPLLRGFVEPSGLIFFQFQRYYAHLTPLLILIVLGAWPRTGAVVQRSFWSWRGLPEAVQRRRTYGWAALNCAGTIVLGILAVGNIETMQVTLAGWVREHTTPQDIVATNDIGAIGFLSDRRILDTVGLVEPELVDHYLRGGDLLSYLRRHDPAYVIIFPGWYPDLAAREDALQEVKRIELGCNVICGGSEMVVYRPTWTAAAGRVNAPPPGNP